MHMAGGGVITSEESRASKEHLPKGRSLASIDTTTSHETIPMKERNYSATDNQKGRAYYEDHLLGDQSKRFKLKS